jgi:predicted XRE-type DNA-binding protein
MKQVQRSRPSGNVFRDLGFSSDEADHLRIRSELMAKVQKVIMAGGFKQAEAAELLGVSQPRVSDLMRGRIDLFNVETLIDMLAKLGVRTKLVLQASRKRAGAV